MLLAAGSWPAILNPQLRSSPTLADQCCSGSSRAWWLAAVAILTDPGESVLQRDPQYQHGPGDDVSILTNPGGRCCSTMVDAVSVRSLTLRSSPTRRIVAVPTPNGSR
jgi:hypothetical protein